MVSAQIGRKIMLSLAKYEDLNQQYYPKPTDVSPQEGKTSHLSKLARFLLTHRKTTRQQGLLLDAFT